jgi:hypothetical protein
LTTHGLFELGIASIIAPLSFNDAVPSPANIRKMAKLGPIEWFKRAAREIAALEMYENYYKSGWTPTLAWQVRHKLGPIIIQTVTLSWYAAIAEAGLLTKKRPRAAAGRQK